MPLVAPDIKKQLQDTIFAAFKREFAKELAGNKNAENTYRRMAAAISDIAMVLVTQLQTNAQVTIPPGGIVTVGSPATQTTVTPSIGTIT